MEYSGYAYKAAAGETFDMIALEVWGDASKAAELLEMNPELDGKQRFDGGEMVRLPVIEMDEDGRPVEEMAEAPWRV